jgi:ubiquinone/menaquinone biosynthesis C-methylase UbiE
MPPKAGDSVLDIGTGTGSLALHIASLVNPNGKVIGVDLSEGMLSQANEKLKNSDLENIDFLLGDMEHLSFPPGSFDKIYCASAFFCVLDPLTTLRLWNHLLKAGGGLAFHAISENSYFWVSEARSVLEKHGFQYLLNTPTGTIEKSHHLLTKAGFNKVDIRKKASGYYKSLEQAKESWITIDDFAPGQYPHPVSNIPKEILNKCQTEYEAKIEQLNTDKGIWNDITMYYIYAYK